MHILTTHFLYNSCLHHVVFQYRRYLQEFGDNGSEPISQSKAYKTLLTNVPAYDFCQFFCKRLVRYFDKDCISVRAPIVITEYRRASTFIGFAPIFTHVRAIGNHWCTNSRFGSKKVPCLFRCGYESDRLAHTIACHAFWDIYFGIFHLTNPGIDLHCALLFESEWIGTCSDRCRFIMLGIHVCFLAFNAVRHGQLMSRRLVTHKLHGYIKTHPGARSFIRTFRRIWRQTA